MADIVSTLFGLPSLNPRDIEEQSRTRDYNTGAQFGAAFINPYGDPNTAALEQKQFASQFALGGALTRGVGGLFGMQSPDQKRAADIQGVLKQTVEEAGTQDPSVIYPAMSKRLSEMGYGEEAFRTGQIGFEAGLKQNQALGDMAYKQSMIEYNKLLGETQRANQEAKLMEQRGQIAYGAMTQLEGTEDPAVADKVWNATLTGLQAKGLDISSLADLPPAERVKALENVVNSSETAAVRTRAEVAEAKLAQQNEQFKEKMAMQETRNSITVAIANLRAEVAYAGQDAANQRAIDNRIAALEKQGNNLDIQIANRANAAAAEKSGTPEFNKQLKGFLTEAGIKDKRELNAATTDFNVKYTSLLGKRGPDGMPLYSPEAALAEAKQFILKGSDTKPKWGGLSEETTYSSTKEIDFNSLK